LEHAAEPEYATQVPKQPRMRSNENAVWVGEYITSIGSAEIV